MPGQLVDAALRSALVATGLMSGMSNILMLTGAIFMLEIYDRVLPSRSVPTLIGLTILVLVNQQLTNEPPLKQVVARTAEAGSADSAAARTSPALVKTLPVPVSPSSVRTITRVWTVYSGRSSSLHPPFGVAPASPMA